MLLSGRTVSYTHLNDTLSIFDKNTNKILANILLDKEDIPKVQKLHWRLNEKGYVIASTKKHKTIKLHNFILERDTSNQKSPGSALSPDIQVPHTFCVSGGSAPVSK